MKKNLPVFVLLTVLSLGCSGGSSTASSDPLDTGAVETKAVSPQAAANLAAVSLQEFTDQVGRDGKLVLVDVWAIW